MVVVSIDPGKKGAIVALDEKRNIRAIKSMPLGRDNFVNYETVYKVLMSINKSYKIEHIFLELAKPMAMGAKHAFNYGMDFKSLEIAVIMTKIPFTLIEPNKWAKKMHQGISSKYKPKVKSAIAVERLYSNQLDKLHITKTGNIHDGQVDAVLIADYGLRLLKGE